MSGKIPDLRMRTPFDGLILSGLDGVAPVKTGSSGKEFPPLSAVLGSNLAYVAMDDASKDTSNIQASAAAIQVILNIHDTMNHHWCGARFALRGDKRNLNLAEVFIAAITGAFTALVNGHKFPNVRTSLSNKNAVIKAAEDAALVKIEFIRARKSEQRGLQKAEEANSRRDRNDDDYTGGHLDSNMDLDGFNSRDNSEPSEPIGNDDDNNYTLIPNPRIQKNRYTFWPLIPESNQTATSIATRMEDAEKARNKRSTVEELAAQFVHQPADPTVKDKRHPTVIQHERKTGIKNVVGTGLHGKLTRKDILEAANNIDNLPEDIKPLFMSHDQLIDYEKKRAAEAKAAASAAKKASAAAEANQQEKLRKIAGGQDDFEHESLVQSPPSKTLPKPMAKATQSKPPSFDPHRVMAASESSILAAHSPLRKLKNRTVAQDSKDTPTAQVNFGIFADSLKNRRALREASGSSVRVTRDGSPVASAPPHEFRIGERKRFTSPALSIDEIEKKLFSPVVPKKHNKLDARHPVGYEREESSETEELTQRSPGPNSAPIPNVKTKTSSQSTKAARKINAQSNSSVGSFGSSVVTQSEVSFQMALVLNMELNSNSNPQKRRRESGVSQAEGQNFSQPQPKRGRPFKLRQHATLFRSASPAVSIVSTAASERPMRVEKTIQPRQSPPSQTTLKGVSSTTNLAIARAAKKAKAEFKVKKEDDNVSAKSSSIDRNSSQAAAKVTAAKKFTDAEKVKLPIAVTNEEYDVEAMVGHRVHDNGITYYHVKWVGYPEEDNTWEPANNLYDAHKILNAYRSGLHKNHQVEDVFGHRKSHGYYRDATGARKTKWFHEYLCKWKGSPKEYNSYENEQTIRERGGLQPLLYYRIRKGLGFGGNGHWSAAKKAAAIKLLKEAGLQPEAGGRISAAEFAETIKDEDDDNDELALSAHQKCVHASAQEDHMRARLFKSATISDTTSSGQ